MGADQQSQATRPGKQKAGSNYSGRFLVRMPSDLHEQLARAAERQEVSLNRYVTDALATSLTPAANEPVETLTPDDPAQTVGSEPPADEPKQAPSPGALRVALATNLAVVVLAGVVAVVLLVLALQRGI